MPTNPPIREATPTTPQATRPTTTPSTQREALPTPGKLEQSPTPSRPIGPQRWM